jgi:MSHA pilin protein MshC
MVELVMVIVVLGIMAVFVLPKLDAGLSLRDSAWRDEVVATMRYAQKSAVAHRRVVCATVSSTSIALTIATVNPAVSCDATLTGMDGSAVFASTSNSGASTAVAPAGVIYFQSDGRVTTDLAGGTAATRTLSGTGWYADITVKGETGYVE